MRKGFVTEKPKYTREDFATFYSGACIDGESNDAYFEAYRGTGILPDSHPLQSKIEFKACGNCKSKDVLVVFAEYSIARHSGDERWTYELWCKECDKFTSYYFNDRLT